MKISAGLIFLICALSGCSGYQTACTSLADLSPDRNHDFSSSCDLEAGDEVRISLRDGRKIEGLIVRVSSTEITVDTEPGTNQPLQFTNEQIYSIDKKSETAGRTVLGVLIIGGVLTAMAVGIANMSFR